MEPSQSTAAGSNLLSPTLAAEEDKICDLGSVRFGTDKVVCNWTIVDYNNWPQGVDEVKSPKFWHSSNSEWCMVLSKERGSWYLCFQLLSCQKDGTVKVRLKASLISGKGKKYEVYPSEFVCLDTPKKTVWRCVSGCFEAENGFNNVLKFQGEVSMPSVIMEPYQNVALRRPQLGVTDDLGALLSSGDLSDVVLLAGDTELKAHRALLSARSPVFAAMLRHDTQEARTGTIDVQDVDPEVLSEVLRFMYTDNTPHLQKMADKLLVAADKYDLPQLKELCELELAKNLAVDNAAATAVVAVSHSCDLLKRSVISFVKRHLVPVMGSDGWADAVRNNAEVVVEISRLIAEESF